MNFLIGPYQFLWLPQCSLSFLSVVCFLSILLSASLFKPRYLVLTFSSVNKTIQCKYSFCGNISQNEFVILATW